MLLKYNVGFVDLQIQVKGDMLYVIGEQVKYRDLCEGIICVNRIVMNDLLDGIKMICIMENCFNMSQATMEIDVVSLKNYFVGELLGYEMMLV